MSVSTFYSVYACASIHMHIHHTRLDIHIRVPPPTSSYSRTQDNRQKVVHGKFHIAVREKK